MTKQEAIAAVRANPDSAEAWYQLGQVMEADGDRVKAQECYERAFKLDPALTGPPEALKRLVEPPPVPVWLQGLEVEAPLSVNLEASANSGPGSSRGLARRYPSFVRPLMWGAILGLVLVAALAGVGTWAVRNSGNEGPADDLSARWCRWQSRSYGEPTAELLRQWVRANKTADSTPRFLLAQPLEDLVDVRDQAADMEVPTCLIAKHSQLLEYMDRTLDAYYAFLAGRSESEVQVKFLQAYRALGLYLINMEEMRIEIPVQPEVEEVFTLVRSVSDSLEDVNDQDLERIAEEASAPPAGGVRDRLLGEDIALTVQDVDIRRSFDGYRAESGKTFIVVEVLLENIGDESMRTGVFDFSLRDGRDVVHDTYFAAPEPELGTANLQRGDRLRGNIAFEVPSEVGRIELLYEEGFETVFVVYLGAVPR